MPSSKTLLGLSRDPVTLVTSTFLLADATISRVGLRLIPKVWYPNFLMVGIIFLHIERSAPSLSPPAAEYIFILHVSDQRLCWRLQVSLSEGQCHG